MRNKIKSPTVFLVIACLLSGFILKAQPFNLNDNIQPVELNLVDYKKDDAKAKGRINMTEVTQVKDTLYFFARGFSMYSPAYFSITTEDASSPIQVTLNKENWHQANKTGETNDKGFWEASFKTEGDFGIMVVPKTKPAKYVLLTWNGDEAKEVGISSPFSDTAVAKTNESFLKKNLIYIIIGAVLLLALLFIVFKRKKNKA
jgi:LPXTG-motif cell wall-anchored protein